MNIAEVAILLTGLIVVVFIFITFLNYLEKKARNEWSVVAKGVFVKTISKFTDARTSTKLTGDYVKLAPLVWTTLVFEDETRIKVINIDKLPPPGTYIKVLKNKRAEFKTET